VGSLDTMRRFYARFVTADIDDPRLTEAFAAVPREAFVGPGPWKVRVDDGYLDTKTDDPVVSNRRSRRVVPGLGGGGSRYHLPL
jgi:protein-L-isoaspartate(D-aspartate) O-methyltransferase